MDKHIQTTQFAGDDKWLQRYGDELWEIICEEAELPEWFTARDVLPFWKNGASEQVRLNQINLVLANVEAQPLPRSEPKQVVKRGHHWQLARHR